MGGPNSAYQIFTNINQFPAEGILGASDITVQQALETLSFITASPTTVVSDWDFGGGGLEIENNTSVPGSCTVGQIFMDTDATSGQQIYGCEGGSFVLQGDGGAGGGDSIIINGSAASDAAFNESNPSIPASGLGVKWQSTGSSPTQITAYAAVSDSTTLAGALSDETGSGGGFVRATSPTITSPTISTSIALPADAVDTITEIAAALKTGVDTKIVTGTAGGSGICAEWNADGDLIEAASAAACGSGGSGDSILINGTAVTNIDFNESSPGTPSSGLSVKWQNGGGNPASVTGYAAVSTSSVLAGVISDETGTGASVFGTSPTITSPTISTSIALPSDAVDSITEIASSLKSGSDSKLITGTAGSTDDCAKWDANGDLITSGAACGSGSGDSIIINGTAVTDAAFNESNPSTPASGLSVKWQRTGSGPDNVAAYAAVQDSSTLAGTLNDETGSGGGFVLATSPTISSPTFSTQWVLTDIMEAKASGVTVINNGLTVSGGPDGITVESTSTSQSSFTTGVTISGGDLTHTGTSSIGWSVVTAANQACNTTCTNGCVFGEDTAVVGTVVACTDASADVCVCAGGS